MNLSYSFFIFLQSETQCSCATLSTIANRVTQFEADIGLLGDVERKLELISASVKQLGLWINDSKKKVK